MATIYSITYQPKDQDYADRQGDFIRVPLEIAKLIADHGIEGDNKAGRHLNRQLNLLSYEWLQDLSHKGYKTEPGQFGEQLILKGVAVEDLEPGDRLQFGDEALIEITKPRTGCVRLAAAQGRTIEFNGGIGMLARVVNGGEIRLGDEVRVLESVTGD